MKEYIKDLINYINNHPDWEESLKKEPYNLKSIVRHTIFNDWVMFNYNLFDSDLSNPVVKACRGSILEIKNNKVTRIICNPYYKFFNFGDPNQDNIDWNTAKTRLKVDGQLIKMFKVDGRDYWCTNGAPGLNTPLDYETEEVHNYKQLMAKALSEKANVKCVYDENDFSCNCDWVSKVPDGWTLMFELTSPQNRIIVKYDETKLWFHGARDAEGKEHEPEDVAKMFGIPYEVPKQFGFDSFEKAFEEIASWKGLENEGIVVCDADYNRVKVKCDDYLKVKFIRDVDTPKGIFWVVISEEYDDLASYPELKEKADLFAEELTKVLNNLKKLHNEICESRKKFEDQKSYAAWVLSEHKDLSKFYFSAAKVSEDDFIKAQLKNLKSEASGYDKYCELKSIVGV